MKIGGRVKTEFRLLPFGLVRTDRAVRGGDFVFTPDLARQAMDWFQRLGRRLAIDYEHQSVSDLNTRSDQLAPTAGWIGRLEVRPDGLWAADVEWTPQAARMLASGEYAYFSPVIFWRGGYGREVAGLGPVSLTNDPAVCEVEALVARTGTAGTDAGLKDTNKGRFHMGKAIEELWRMEFEKSPALRAEFGDDLEVFLAYRRHEGTGPAKAKRREAAGSPKTSLAALKREWNLNRPNERGVCLQDEFGGDEEAFLAYKRHEKDVSIFRRRN